MRKLLYISLLVTILVNCGPSLSKDNSVQEQQYIFKQVPVITSNEVNDQVMISDLKPLPLNMPTFEIGDDGLVSMRNVFDFVQKEYLEMEDKIKNENDKIIQKINMRRENLEDIFNVDFNEMKNSNNRDRANILFEITFSQQPLVGGGNHDYWNKELRQNIQQKNQQKSVILGGDDHDNWGKQSQEIKTDTSGLQLIGKDDHDNWAQISQQQDKKDNRKHWFPTKIWKNLKKQEKQHKNELLGGQTDPDNHYDGSQIMPGGNSDKDSKKLVDQVVKGILNMQQIGKSNNQNKEINVQNIAQSNLLKPEVLIK